MREPLSLPFTRNVLTFVNTTAIVDYCIWQKFSFFARTLASCNSGRVHKRQDITSTLPPSFCHPHPHSPPQYPLATPQPFPPPSKLPVHIGSSPNLPPSPFPHPPQIPNPHLIPRTKTPPIALVPPQGQPAKYIPAPSIQRLSQ